MFYKAQHKETGNMWDVWLFHHHDIYYLYYLGNTDYVEGELPWDNISLATSTDCVHWTEQGPILKKSETANWMGTGSTWKSPNFDEDQSFYMNFSEEIGDRQNIYFAASKDLINWNRLEGEDYRFVQDEQWYQKKGRWDCIWTLAKAGGGLYGYWTACPISNESKFGFGESEDGIHWKALEPPKVSGIDREHSEVGAVEKIGNKYYMLMGNYFPYMVTLIADEPHGPFLPAQKNFNLLTGHTYFCRFFSHPSGTMLVCHFIMTRFGEVSFAPLKVARVDDEGTLRLGWWEGNEPMKHNAVSLVQTDDLETDIVFLKDKLDTSTGIILEGHLCLPNSKEEPRSGVFIECKDGIDYAVLFDHLGKAEVGVMQKSDLAFETEKSIDREILFDQNPRFRLLLKGELMEFYLDDILIESFALSRVATGRIGFIRSPESIQPLTAWKWHLQE